MADPHRLDDEHAADLEGLSRSDLAQVGADPDLFELVANQAEGEPGAPDGHADSLQQKAERADVIFVGVGEHHPLERLRIGEQPAEVGDDDLDPRHVAPRKHQPAVHQQPFAGVLERHAVEADFAEASEWNDPEHRAGTVTVGFHNRSSNVFAVK